MRILRHQDQRGAVKHHQIRDSASKRSRPTTLALDLPGTKRRHSSICSWRARRRGQLSLPRGQLSPRARRGQLNLRPGQLSLRPGHGRGQQRRSNIARRRGRRSLPCNWHASRRGQRSRNLLAWQRGHRVTVGQRGIVERPHRHGAGALERRLRHGVAGRGALDRRLRHGVAARRIGWNWQQAGRRRRRARTCNHWRWGLVSGEVTCFSGCSSSGCVMVKLAIM